KNLGCYGDGGAVLTSSRPLCDIAKSIRDYGQVEKYSHAVFGLNSRLDELQAAFLRTALLPRLTSWTQNRRAIADRYRTGIDHPLIQIVPVPEGSTSCWHLFPIKVENRDSLKKWLWENQVHSAIHYPKLIPDQPIFENPEMKSQFEIKTPLRQAKKLTEQELSLPIHPFLSESEIHRVIEVCNSWRGEP
ncbi:MAG: DegT/DnrJ/EryC1/StrS family aminotransferase, partial [Deltaproteobacteria bacterium]